MRVKIIMLILLAWAHVAQADPMSEFGVLQPKVRMLAPDFSLQDLDGKLHRLSAYRGKLVVLHFWATWCAPCRYEIPILHALGERLAGENILLLSVNVDRGHREGVQSFARTLGQGFHTLLDADGDVRTAYAVRALPTTYIIGRDGRFSGLIVGARDWNKAMPMLSQFINAK